MATGAEIREMFLRYFEEQGHTRVHSSSLVPANDPTLLFTNAGMNQFKDAFLGLEKRSYNRACSSQKCVRAGGKHNDLENVGFTNRHHTFFEMLGNFSFGDYFKKEAIAYAWELLTDKKWYGIPKDKLYCTIFKGEGGVGRDDEAEKYWLEVGVPKERIHAFGMKDNFWQMGDTGPCGPCSEVHYDMGPQASDLGHKDCAFGCDCGRYVEVWNLVFMQFDRDAQGKLTPLPKPCVDTGMGLERVASVLQGKISNYDTDLFQPLIQRAAELTGVNLKKELEKEAHSKQAASLRVIADHARATTFLIADDVVPGSGKREYVLRRIMRRAIRHGRQLGEDQPFLCEMVYSVCELMKGAYPELAEKADRIAGIVSREEGRFSNTLAKGWEHFTATLPIIVGDQLTEFIRSHPDSAAKLKAYDVDPSGRATSGLDHEAIGRRLVSGVLPEDFLAPEDVIYLVTLINSAYGKIFRLPGFDAFRLYSTYGFPRDFMEDICSDYGIEFDAAGFEAAQAEDRDLARASWKGGAKATASPVYKSFASGTLTKPFPGTIPGGSPIISHHSDFVGYDRFEVRGATVQALVWEGNRVEALSPSQQGEVILDFTPFYAEAGGQVGDVGWFYDSSHNVVAEVRGCYAPVQGVRAHKVVAKQPIVVGDRVTATVDAGVREHTMRNHTATHLLHAALRETLGKHVKQAGSLVAPDHLRFDFSHFTSVADEELQDIEDLINKEVLRNRKVEVIPDVPIDVAVNEYKAMALFGEKYGDKVRVIRIGDFSTELCGGTHTAATGEIGLVKILHEGSVSSGVRRVEAVSGEGSLAHFRRDHELESVVKTLVGRSEASLSPAEVLKAELERNADEIKKLTKELERARMKSASASVAASEDQVRVVSGVKVLAQRVENLDRPQMRVLVDNLRQKLGSGVVVLGSAADGKVSLIVGVTKDLAERVPAGKVIGPVAKKVGGSGGGRPDLAEAGGKDPEALDAALAEVFAVVQSLLK